MNTPELFMFYIGGSAGMSTIEVHDIQFVVAHSVTDAIPTLRQRWFGDPQKIHLDGYTILDWADGYDIILSSEPSSQTEKLFFVYAGAYLPHTLAEQHEYGLFVAENAEQAKAKALQTLLVGYDQQHKDTLKDVDSCIKLSTFTLSGSATQGNYFVHLHPNPQGSANKPLWQGYRPIGE